MVNLNTIKLLSWLKCCEPLFFDDMDQNIYFTHEITMCKTKRNNKYKNYSGL